MSQPATGVLPPLRLGGLSVSELGEVFLRMRFCPTLLLSESAPPLLVETSQSVA
jgi:hypothetical protein